MNKNKLWFWISTGLLFLLISLPALFFNSAMAKMSMMHYGFPAYFGVELGLAKFIGGLVLIIPAFSRRHKEWAYAGFGIDFVSAFIAICVVDGFGLPALLPVLALVVLATSYHYFHKIS